MIHTVVPAAHPADRRPAPPPQTTAGEAPARLDRQEPGDPPQPSPGSDVDDAGQVVRFPDLTGIALADMSSVDRSILVDALQRVLRSVSEPGEAYAAHGNTLDVPAAVAQPRRAPPQQDGRHLRTQVDQ
ncbi:hypothetical protein RB614_09105 [Phytohabitans sp. ZYX-F-186]|uniref:FXSXX-COOH protein n=1 Tax=Phytohabitans maris TaxID=3071409 RepID=A0ABU0ZC98_9ACTN|nr:hypothetical protein [Phytohabitans sp. ZYX-F-186]MDQ7904677.1 hypothetical protein [Phytohabitans sp. ZYX-F-186]